MAKLRGRGYAAVNYPTGMNLGGDPTQALVHSTTTGNFVVSLSSVDLGQGLKTVAAQVAAETLGLPYENIIVDTADTDTGPHCMGTFASRGTHRVGNAVIMAAQEAREAMLAAAAEELEVDAEDLETDGTGFIKLKGSEEKKIHIVDLALAAHCAAIVLMPWPRSTEESVTTNDPVVVEWMSAWEGSPPRFMPVG